MIAETLEAVSVSRGEIVMAFLSCRMTKTLAASILGWTFLNADWTDQDSNLQKSFFSVPCHPPNPSIPLKKSRLTRNRKSKIANLSPVLRFPR